MSKSSHGLSNSEGNHNARERGKGENYSFPQRANKGMTIDNYLMLQFPMCGIPRGAIIDQITYNPKQMPTCCNTTTVVVIINSKSIKKKLKSPIWWQLFHLCHTILELL